MCIRLPDLVANLMFRYRPEMASLCMQAVEQEQIPIMTIWLHVKCNLCNFPLNLLSDSFVKTSLIKALVMLPNITLE